MKCRYEMSFGAHGPACGNEHNNKQTRTQTATPTALDTKRDEAGTSRPWWDKQNNQKMAHAIRVTHGFNGVHTTIQGGFSVSRGSRWVSQWIARPGRL